MAELNEGVAELLELFAFDDCDSLWWNVVGGKLEFYVDCSDRFDWGSADAEVVYLPADLSELRLAKRDNPQGDWPTLWVARRRGRRPQPPVYQYLDDYEKPLFDACGPERIS